MRYYSSDEVKKLIKAFQEKYNIPSCNGLPYYMKDAEIDLKKMQTDIEELKNKIEQILPTVT